MISIHALREEGDVRGGHSVGLNKIFLSTPSARRATSLVLKVAAVRNISIHALREEGDTIAFIIEPEPPNFYPRPPRGGRPFGVLCGRVGVKISIHALREEGDQGQGHEVAGSQAFLSTPSARRATELECFFRNERRVFLSTPSARRATRARGVLRLNAGISIHALREEGDFRE